MTEKMSAAELESMARRCAETPGDPAHYAIPVVEVRKLLSHMAALETERDDARNSFARFKATTAARDCDGCGAPISGTIMYVTGTGMFHGPQCAALKGNSPGGSRG